MTLTKREKHLLLIAVIIVGVVFGGKYVVLPYINNYCLLKDRIISLEHDLQRDRMIINDMDKYTNFLQDTSLKLTNLKGKFFKGKVQDVKIMVLNILDNDVKESGLVLKSKNITLQYTPDIDPVKINYQATLEGDLLSTVAFLKRLNSHNKCIKVSELDMKGGSHMDKLSIYIVINTYCLEDEQNE